MAIFCKLDKKSLNLLVNDQLNSSLNSTHQCSPGCLWRIRKTFEFKIWKELLLVEKKAINQQKGQKCIHYEPALSEWKLSSGSGDLPQNPIFQSEWDKPLYEARFDLLLNSVTSEAEIARLLSVSSENASDWLYAIPIPSLGLHLDPMQVHIACGLRLGANLCHPHECKCGEMVESNGRHGLKCKQAGGRKYRHEEGNKLLKLGEIRNGETLNLKNF